MSLHTWHPQGPHNPSSCTTFTLNPHWYRAATGKKKSCVYARGVTLVVSVFATLWTLAYQASLSRGWGEALQARTLDILANTGCQTLLRHCISCCPSHQLPSVLQEHLWLNQLYHLHIWTLLGQTQVLQGSLRSKPQWTIQMQRWK